MKRILIIDDAATVRLYHKQILAPLGYEVLEAANGYEALEKVLKEPVDLMLVDVNMPKMDGYTLLKMIRKDDQGLNAIPAIVISTEVELRDARAAYLSGANMYLTKPIKPATLKTYVRLMAGERTS